MQIAAAYLSRDTDHYGRASNITHKILRLKCFPSRFALVFAQTVEASREWGCSWSSSDRQCSKFIWVINILLPTKVRFKLEVWRYFMQCFMPVVEYAKFMDHSGYGLNQWETTSHYNIVSHWLILYPEWSMKLRCTRPWVMITWNREPSIWIIIDKPESCMYL